MPILWKVFARVGSHLAQCTERQWSGGEGLALTDLQLALSQSWDVCPVSGMFCDTLGKFCTCSSESFQLDKLSSPFPDFSRKTNPTNLNRALSIPDISFPAYTSRAPLRPIECHSTFWSSLPVSKVGKRQIPSSRAVGFSCAECNQSWWQIQGTKWGHLRLFLKEVWNQEAEAQQASG